MATRPYRPVRTVLRTAVVSLALVGGTLVVTPAAAVPTLSPLLPCGSPPLTPPCPPETEVAGPTPAPNATGWVNRRTVSVSFTHSYAGTAPAGQTTFECRLQGSAPQPWTPCTSPTSFTGLPDTSRSNPEDVHRIDVRAVHPDGVTRDQTPATVAFRLDATAPDTHLLGAPTLVGPRRNLLLTNTATFQYAVLNHSDESGGDPVFRCTFDGQALSCPETRGTTNGSRTLTGIKPGDHRFTVAGVDQADNVSQPPEAFAFHTPYNRVGLRRQIRRMWTRVAAPGHYLDDYVVTRKKGSVLSRKFRNFNEVYLIVAKGPGHGRIRVDLGDTRVRTTKLSARTFKRKQIVKVTIPGGRRTSGRLKVTVVSPSGRPVMIDAIAVR